MKHRDFVYVGAPVPELNEQEHATFYLHIQKAILLSLEQRNLLTPHQRERCTAELEQRYNPSQKKELCYDKQI